LDNQEIKKLKERIKKKNELIKKLQSENEQLEIIRNHNYNYGKHYFEKYRVLKKILLNKFYKITYEVVKKDNKNDIIEHRKIKMMKASHFDELIFDLEYEYNKIYNPQNKYHLEIAINLIDIVEIAS